MSRSYRDKRGFKARNPEKYIEGEIDGDSMFKNGLYPTKDFPKIAWAIQGKRRRNSTRKANQKAKQMSHQLLRAKLKEEAKKQIKEALCEAKEKD